MEEGKAEAEVVVEAEVVPQETVRRAEALVHDLPSQYPDRLAVETRRPRTVLVAERSRQFQVGSSSLGEAKAEEREAKYLVQSKISRLKTCMTLPLNDPFTSSRTYGSGYPGLTNQRGVSNLNFPFFFWPLVWGGAAFHGPAYLDDTEVRHSFEIKQFNEVLIP